MPYVMVPVPEEHEEEFQQEILKMSLREKLGDWDAELLTAIWDQSEPRSRALISSLTRAGSEHRRMSREDLASELDLDPIELLGVTNEINDRCSALSLPYLILTSAWIDPDGEEVTELLITQNATVILIPMLQD